MGETASLILFALVCGCHDLGLCFSQGFKSKNKPSSKQQIQFLVICVFYTKKQEE